MIYLKKEQDWLTPTLTGIVNFIKKSYPNWQVKIIHRNKSHKKVIQKSYPIFLSKLNLNYLTWLYNSYTSPVSS